MRLSRLTRYISSAPVSSLRFHLQRISWIWHPSCSPGELPARVPLRNHVIFFIPLSWDRTGGDSKSSTADAVSPRTDNNENEMFRFGSVRHFLFIYVLSRSRVSPPPPPVWQSSIESWNQFIYRPHRDRASQSRRGRFLSWVRVRVRVWVWVWATTNCNPNPGRVQKTRDVVPRWNIITRYYYIYYDIDIRTGIYNIFRLG